MYAIQHIVFVLLTELRHVILHFTFLQTFDHDNDIPVIRRHIICILTSLPSEYEDLAILMLSNNWILFTSLFPTKFVDLGIPWWYKQVILSKVWALKSILQINEDESEELVTIGTPY